MQIKFFTIPINDPADGEKELNAFLRSRRVLEVTHEFAADGAGSRWCLMVKTLDSQKSDGGRTGGRSGQVDYRQVLDDASFVRFCALRKARKAVAEAEGIPAFALFTDKQMAELARLETLTLENMRTVEGIGPGKTEKYGPAVIRQLNSEDEPFSQGTGHETGG